jgi:hypothetical protein
MMGSTSWETSFLLRLNHVSGLNVGFLPSVRVIFAVLSFNIVIPLELARVLGGIIFLNGMKRHFYKEQTFPERDDTFPFTPRKQLENFNGVRCFLVSLRQCQVIARGGRRGFHAFRFSCQRA